MSELPSAPRVKVERPATNATTAKPNDAPRPPDPDATPAPAGTPAKVAASPATLVRKNPFDDPNAAEIPVPPPEASVPVDRTKLTRVKNLLLSKVRSGSASDSDLKQLHALCRTLGDASCSN